MDLQPAILCLLTFIIHLIGTLAYSVRIAGVRTRRIAMSFALFNVLVSEPSFRRAVVCLVGSRFAGTLLAQWLLLPAATFIAYVAHQL